MPHKNIVLPMKESIIVMSFSALLFASSGIHSQATDEITSTTQTALNTTETAPLLLAKVNNINDELKPRLNGSKNETIIDSAPAKTSPTPAIKETRSQATIKNYQLYD